MKPAQVRDLAKLRRRILLEIFQHPATLFPWAVSALSAFWAVGIRPTPATVIAAIGGAAAGLAGLFYNLIFRGAAIRDGILAKWEREAEQEEDLTRAALRSALQRTRGTDDLLELFGQLETLYDEAVRALQTPGISEVMRAHFEPVIEENYNSAIAVLNKLAFLQQRLINLLDSRSSDESAYKKKITQMRRNRQAMVKHLREVNGALERASVEIPQLATPEVESAQHNLVQLQESLELAKRAYEGLKLTTDPPSGLYRPSGEARPPAAKQVE